MNLQSYYNELFSYERDTGNLYWKKRPATSKSNNIFNSLFAHKIAGSISTSKSSKTSYIAVKTKLRTEKAHRIIFAMIYGYTPKEVDHIDHNGLNNKLENLRASNSRDNSKNMPMQKSNKSGCIGVNWHKAAKKWHARAVNLNGERVDLGRYDDINEAIRVRKKYEKEFMYYDDRSDI